MTVRSPISRRSLAIPLVGLATIAIVTFLWYRPSSGDHFVGLAIVPQNGSGSVQGKYMANGIAMYLADHPDTQLRVNTVDSNSDPNAAIAALNQAYALDEPDFVLVALSHVAGAVIPQTQKRGTLTLLVVSSAESILQGRTVVQRINPRAQDYVGPLSTFAKTRYATAGVIFSDEEYGRSNAAAFESQFSGNGRRVVSTEHYGLGDTTTVRSSVLKLLASKPETVFVTGYGPAYFAIFGALKEYGYKGQILACPNIGQPEALVRVADAAEGVVFSATDMELSSPERPQTRAFAERYRAAYKSEPFYVAAYVYDSLSIAEKLTREKLTLSPASILAQQTWEAVTGTLKFLPGGECAASMIAIRREKGRNLKVD